jgi:hypothetical protein
MTRTQGMASSRPQITAAATIGSASGRRLGLRGRRRFARRELLALPVVLALLVPAAPAFAATSTGTSSTGTSGYSQKPPTPTTKTEPKKAVEPSKEAAKTTPTATPEPAKEATTPTTTPKASTLPFTGLNLTWVVGAGVLLLGAGLSIRLGLRTRSGR